MISDTAEGTGLRETCDRQNYNYRCKTDYPLVSTVPMQVTTPAGFGMVYRKHPEGIMAKQADHRWVPMSSAETDMVIAH